MKKEMNRHLIRPALRGLVLALAVTALSSYVARAVPYASQVVQSGNTVTFILNQAAEGMTVLRDGANPVTPTPGPATPGPQSFDMTGYSTYSIIVTGNTAAAWTQFIPDGTDSNFEYPRGVSINKNPASTNFGKVYVSVARDGTTVAGRSTPSGIYVLRADGVAEGGVQTGGVNWSAIGNSSPWKSNIGPDDHLYVADFSNDLAYEFNDDLSVATQLIDASNKTTSPSPQYVESVWVEGTQAGGDRAIYTVDSNYYDTGRKGLIRYDLGANATATASDLGTQIIGPSYYTYYPKDVTRDSSGNWYLNQYRATAGQAPAIDKFDGTIVPNNTPIWSTASTPYTYTYGIGLNEVRGSVAVGSVVNATVWFFTMSTGDFLESFDAGGIVGDLAFDAVGNLVTVDNNQEYARFWDPGGFTIATTSSDGTLDLFTPSANVSVTATTDTTSMDTTQPPGVFTVTRSGSTAGTLTVDYELSGTATNGTHYVTLPGSVTFDVGASSTNIDVVAIPVTPAGPTRSVALTLLGSELYTPYPPSEATVWIVDTNTPAIWVAARDAQMYERTNDYARFRLTRWGDTNVYLAAVNVSYGGTATEGTQFFASDYTNITATFSAGQVTADVYAYALHDGIVTGPLTVTATVEPSTPGFGDYDVGTPATSDPGATRVDSDDPPENVIWSDNLHTDTSANWTQRFATTNDAPYDATVTWAYDYSGPPEYAPPAPHSGGDTHGLYMTVNKNDAQLAAAALNLYPNGQSFSGNYALKFDMYLVQNDTSGTTEYALFGINHSGTKTNWFRNSTAGFVGVNPVGWDFDGVFYSVESDGAHLGDYVGYSAPTTVGINPTPITDGVSASTLTGIFKTPPWTPGAGSGGAAANLYGSGTPMWADVEIRQVDGVISYYINHTLIFAYTNTTGYESGNIMLGYTDAYDSIGSTGGSVIFANARVIGLTGAATITSIVPSGANVDINYTGGSGTQFVLLNSSTVTAPLSGWSRTATNYTGSGTFSVPASAPAFYSIKSE